MSDLPPLPVTSVAFSELFRGGKIAKAGSDFRPMQDWSGGFCTAYGITFQTAVEDHLSVPELPIGVYPLLEVTEASEGQETGVSKYMVYWGCVDWDVGEEESLIHALNVQELLKQLNVASWVEISRSKGYHLWVFFSEPILARHCREGLIAACNIVDAPITEVNPKQIELTGKGWGNGVRLPYPAGAEPGRNVVIRHGEEMTASQFATTALMSRVLPEEWEPVHALYKPAPPPPPRKTYATRNSGKLTGLAEAIRRNGPRPEPNKPNGDRSATLFSLACAMVEQGYPSGDIEEELIDADIAWGSKFNNRSDGRQRISNMVADAERTVRT